jgi:hypothetical protein
MNEKLRGAFSYLPANAPIVLFRAEQTVEENQWSIIIIVIIAGVDIFIFSTAARRLSAQDS